MQQRLITMASFLITATLAALTYLGFIAGVDGAQYLVKFFVWAVCFPSGLLALTNTMQKNLAEGGPSNAVQRLIFQCVAWPVLVVIVWQGHIATGMAWGFYMLCCAISAHGVKRIRERTAADAAVGQ